MVITDVTLETLPKFYDCFQELMVEGYGNFPPELVKHFLEKDYSLRNFNLWVERSFRKISLAVESGYVMGFIVGDRTYGGVGFISWLGVRPPFRKKHIGAKLLKNYENFAKARHAHVIELYTFDKVKPFYLKQGYKEIGRRAEGYFGRKNIIMDKVLGPWNSKTLNIDPFN